VCEITTGMDNVATTTRMLSQSLAPESPFRPIVGSGAARHRASMSTTEKRLVPCRLYDVRFGGVQVRASQGRRGRDTGSYLDRGERSEVRAWASRKPRDRGDGVLAALGWD
jgi:hypothetical protein